MRLVKLIGDPALPFHINSKETFDLIGGIGIVWWIGFVVFFLWGVMAAAAAGAPPKRENKQTKPIQIKPNKESEWSEMKQSKGNSKESINLLNWFVECRSVALLNERNGRAPRQRGSAAGNYERQRKAQQAKRNKFLFVGRCSWRSLIDCGAVLPPSINSLRFRHTAGQPNQTLQWNWMALNSISWSLIGDCAMFT